MTNKEIAKLNDLPDDMPILHHLKRVGGKPGRFQAQYGGRTIYTDANDYWGIGGKKIASNATHIASAL